MIVISVSLTHLSISAGVWAANEPGRKEGISKGIIYFIHYLLGQVIIIIFLLFVEPAIKH